LTGDALEKQKKASKQASKQAIIIPSHLSPFMSFLLRISSFTQLSELQKMFNLFSRLLNNLEKIFHFPETI
jgi:hypothetical protein